MTQSAAQAQSEDLVGIRALTAAVASAISALQGNDLAGLQASLADQEALCRRIPAFKLKAAANNLAKATTRPASADQSDEVRRAYLELADLNRVYGALLKRCERTVQMIAGLYNCYGVYDKSLAVRKPGPSLSCEV